MNIARPLLRASRLLRPAQAWNSRSTLRAPRQRRYQSSEPRQPRTHSEDAKSFNPAAVGSIAGGVIAFACCYAWYQLSGTKSLVKSAQQTKKYLDVTRQNFQDTTPNPKEALKWLRQTATSYAAYVPGDSVFVNSAFDELDSVHDSHREEVDSIINDCYAELKQVSQQGLNVDSAKQGWNIVVRHLRKVHLLTNNVMVEVVNRHPELKARLGRSVDQLRQMGDKLGPEAKQIVDQAGNDASEIAKTGGSLLSAENINKIEKLVQDTTERVRKLGDEAWTRAMQQAKPYLDKNSQIKQFVEQNSSALKQSNAQELLEKIKSAVDNGDVSELQDYLRQPIRNAQSRGISSIQEYLEKIPGGDQILPNMSKMQEIAQKHGKEAEELFNSTISEISQVLARKAEEAKKLSERTESRGTVGRAWFGRK